MALYADTSFPPNLDPTPSANATIGLASGQLLAANSNRKGFTIRNTSSRIIYLGINNTVSITGNYFASIPVNGLYEWSLASIYTGAIFAVSNQAGATAQVFELIP